MTSQPRPTQADVARLAGASTATVSYILSGRSSRSTPASPETQQRVFDAMEQLGYNPQWAARALKRRPSGIVTVLTHVPLPTLSSELISQVQDLAGAREMETVFLQYSDDASLARQLRLVRGGLADALVVMGLENMAEATQSRLAALPIPVLAAANEAPPGLSLIRRHERAALIDLFAHLRRSGSQGVHYVTATPRVNRRVLDRRTAVVTEAAAMTGVVPVLHRVAVAPDPAQARAILDGISVDGTQAVVCQSDRMAITLACVARNAGIAVPGALRIAGMGNIAEGTLTQPSLTTVGVRDPDYRSVIGHLLDRAEDPTIAPETFDTPWELLVRDSA